MRLVRYIVNSLYKSIFNVVLKKKYIYIWICERDLEFLLCFFKWHSCLKYRVMFDLFMVDFPFLINRFELNYCLLSLKMCYRLLLKLYMPLFGVFRSVRHIYSSANWFEREVWDLFGIYFDGNKDMRRILLDYGFKGHAMHKSFPLVGYVEVRYSDEKHRIVMEPVEFAQEYRFYEFNTPWDCNYNELLDMD